MFHRLKIVQVEVIGSGIIQHGGNVTTDVPVIGNVTDNSGNVTDNSGNVTSPIEPEVPITPPSGNSTEPLPPVIIDNGDNGTYYC